MRMLASILQNSLVERVRPNERPILLIGGVHGDEPEGVELATKTLEWLLSEEKAGRPSPASWIVLPCLNPDGFTLKTRTNKNGVDLNRNYPSLCWSPEAKTPRYNPGPAPASEIEVQFLVNLIKTKKPHLIIHCHSWHPCVVYTGEAGKKDAERLARSSGYKAQPDIGYPTPGSLSCYAYLDNGIPVICIEEESGAPLEKVWPHFAEGMKEIFSDNSERSPLRGIR
jgi:predicted deacylase